MTTTIILTVLATAAYLLVGVLLASRWAINVFSLVLLTVLWPLWLFILLLCAVGGALYDRKH